MTLPERDDEPQPSLTPFFEAAHTNRFERQRLIRKYEDEFGCHLVVLVDAIFPQAIAYFEDLLHDVDRDRDLHLLLASPGGDGETALRLLRAAQARCRRLVVLVLDRAKSAATLIALGAHEIVMSSTSDLGPIDPQFPRGAELISAKDIIQAVERATLEVREFPDTYPFHASLLSDVNAMMVENARRAMGRTKSQLHEALVANPERSEEETVQLESQLTGPLIDAAESHSALFGLREAMDTSLPVRSLDPESAQWRLIWRLWTRYVASDSSFYEGRRASHAIPPPS